MLPYPRKKKPNVVGGASLQLHSGKQAEYFNIGAKDYNKDWVEEWYYVGNHPPQLPKRTRRAPLPEAS